MMGRHVISVVFSMLLTVSALDISQLDSISDFFNNLYKTDTSDEMEKISVEEMERIKRQTTDIGDESQLPYEIRSSSLPMNGDRSINTRYTPTLGNGNIGVSVYDDVMYLNGLYNGAGGQSHRAAIPAMLMTRVNLSSPLIEARAQRKFVFNAQDGFFMETIDCEYAYIEHKMYMHQKYIRLFVVDIYARMKPTAIGGITLTMKYPPINSTDIHFSTPFPYQANWEVTGSTITAEAGEKVQNVYIFYSIPLPQINVGGQQAIANYTQIMSVDKTESNARSEFDVASKMTSQPGGSHQLFMEHVNAWRNTWATGRVEVVGDPVLAKTVRFAQYYILSSLPAEFPYLPPLHSEVFYGCGRTSLARGELNEDYQGHVMYDNEFYILPAILPFHPVMAKKMLRYRSAMAGNAAANAKLFGGIGNHFPWESAYTGAEVTPNVCPSDHLNCNWNRLYTTAAVGYAIRQYFSITRDRDYMINPDYAGCDQTREIAKFLANQAVYNPEHSRYDMNDITGPDDWHPNINNNAFTLCATSLAIHWARYFACLCQRDERAEVSDEQVQKALYLNLPYDNVKRLHYQYDGFNPDTDRPIKQADVIMLNYPLNWNYSWDIMKNDLEFYENMISDRTPAMTYSWMTIGWKWVHEISKMRSYFLKSYQNYLIQPFKIWTEYNERSAADQAVGNVNFLPGMGAFLQSVVHGFGGFRIRPDQLQVFNPQPPPGCNQLYLYGFKYLGSNMTFLIENDKTTIWVNSINTLLPLILRRNQTGASEESLTNGAVVTITQASQGFTIYTSVSETCEQPRDYIFMPWGYSPWVNGALSRHRHLERTNSIFLLVVFLTLHLMCRLYI